MLGISGTPVLCTWQSGTTGSLMDGHHYRKGKTLGASWDVSDKVLSACHCTCKAFPSHLTSFPYPSSCLAPPSPHAHSTRFFATGSALMQAMSKANPSPSSLVLSCWFPKSSSVEDALKLLSSQQGIIRLVPRLSTLGGIAPGIECKVSPCHL